MKPKTEFFAMIIVLLIGLLLRFWQLGQNPASLYWDEAAILLDAHSISVSGLDINNQHWLQPVLGSYGDFKAPVLIWLTSLFVPIFGAEALAVRVPIALLSVFTIYLVYVLAKQLLSFDQKLYSSFRYIPFLSAALVAISPWSVHFGRIGFESSLSVTFLLLTLIFFIHGLKKHGFFIILSSVFAVGGVYSYYSLRLVLPLLALALLWIFYREVKQQKLHTAVGALIFVGAMIPLLISPYYHRSQDYRLNNNNLIHHRQVIEESSNYLERYNSSLYARLVYHRYLLVTRDFLSNMGSHFSFDFLFLRGDANLRQHSGYLGEFLLVSLPFYLYGWWSLIKNRKSKLARVLCSLLLITPIPAAMVYEVPHASRAIYLFIPFALLIAWGLAAFLTRVRAWLGFLLLGLFIVNSVFYYADYFVDYPKRSSRAWLYTYNEVAQYIRQHYQEYGSIEIDDQYWLPHIFVYQQFPEIAEQTRGLKEAFLNSPVNSFGLPNPFDYILDKNNKRTAQFISYEKAIPEGYRLVKEFKFLNGEPSLILIDTEEQLEVQ